MNRFMWLLAVLLLAVITANISIAGEYYEYTDKDGNKMFTDDISKVPESHRSGVKTFQTVEPAPQPSDTQINNETDSNTSEEGVNPEDETAPGETGSNTSVASGNSSKNSDYEIMKRQFDREKAKLDQQLRKLQEERKSLAGYNVKNMNQRQLNAYEGKVKDLDSRIEKQQQAQSQFMERVRRFNDRIKNNQPVNSETNNNAGPNT